MDPDQCYEDFVDALHTSDIELAAHRLSELAAWVRGGGFAPAKLRGRFSNAELANHLADTALVLALAAGMEEP